MPLDLKGATVRIQLSPDRFDSRDAADGLFPGHVLERYHVIFDYPGHKFTLAAPGSLKPRGNAVSSPLKRENGFPRVEVAIGDQKVGMLLDTGASFTMISRKAMDDWSASAPNPWPRHNGAVGAANMALNGDAVMPMVRRRLRDPQRRCCRPPRRHIREMVFVKRGQLSNGRPYTRRTCGERPSTVSRRDRLRRRCCLF